MQRPAAIWPTARKSAARNMGKTEAKRLLVVEDDRPIAELVKHHFAERRLHRHHHRQWRRSSDPDRRDRPGPSHPRLDDRRDERDRGVPARSALALHHRLADHHADGSWRGRRSHPGPRDRGRRFRLEAVQPEGAPGESQCPPPPLVTEPCRGKVVVLEELSWTALLIAFAGTAERLHWVRPNTGSSTTFSNIPRGCFPGSSCSK